MIHRAATPRLLRNLTLAGATVAISMAGPGLADTAHGHSDAKVWLAQATSGEGGEGGESGSAAEMPDEAAYLTSLSLIEGHLRVGFALYADGQADLAITHMKHPKDEIYTSLEPQLAKAGAAGFADELAALADSVTAKKPLPEVEAAYTALLEKTRAARDASKAGPRAVFDSIIAVTRVAAEEHAIGIVDGKVSNLHEYQDAWGFIETAKVLAQNLAGSDDPKVAAAAGKTISALDATAPAFAGLVPTAVTGGGDILLAAAGTIELAAYGVK